MTREYNPKYIFRIQPKFKEGDRVETQCYLQVEKAWLYNDQDWYYDLLLVRPNDDRRTIVGSLHESKLALAGPDPAERIAELEEFAWDTLHQFGDWNEALTEVDVMARSLLEDLAAYFVKAGKLVKVNDRLYRVKGA